VIPVLLALKGNLDMTLASRLSTAAHTGIFNDTKKGLSLIGYNLAVLQVQAIVVGALASLVALILHACFGNPISASHSIVLLTSSLVTATLSAFLLGLFTALLVMYSSRHHFNPDNFATPIVASLGDISTLYFLSTSADMFFDLEKSSANWFLYVLAVVLILRWVKSTELYAAF
jgi:solute carrier family 41